MAIYVKDPTTGEYKPLKIPSEQDQARLYSQLLNNRIMLLKALQKAGLSVSHTPDYVYSDIFTDANGWQDTIDTNGTDAYYDSDGKYYSSLQNLGSYAGPHSKYSSTSVESGSSFLVYYTGTAPLWKITRVYFEFRIYNSWYYIDIYRLDTNDLVFSGKVLSPNTVEVVDIDTSSMPYVPKSIGLKVTISGAWYSYNATYDQTENNVRIYGDGSTYKVPAYNHTYSFSIVDVTTGSISDKHIKTNTFSLSSPIKQLLVFADRELVNNAQEMEVEVYDTNDTLLASGTIGELIDISEYNKSSVYLKLKLHGSGSAYTKAYGYGVAFWV